MLKLITAVPIASVSAARISATSSSDRRIATASAALRASAGLWIPGGEAAVYMWQRVGGEVTVKKRAGRIRRPQPLGKLDGDLGRE
ncbi:hypothetical protein ABIE78_003635 [Sinorhizobium fredii]